MTPQEFKAWFDGFTEALTGTPNVQQWEKIKARAAEIDNVPTTHTVYVDRYLTPYHYPWHYVAPKSPSWTETWCSSSLQSLSGTTSGTTTCTTGSPAIQLSASNDLNFNSSSAMYTLGKLDSEASL